MVITLSDTTSAKISSALLSARRSAGSPASGMVLTLIIVSTEDEYAAALDAAMSAGREHPCRILLVVTGNGRHTPSLDAEVRIGEGTSGEVVVVRMRGPLADHPASVIRPLLLPDSPVVVWWPGSVPTSKTASDSLAELSNRRITDASAARQPRRELIRRAEQLSEGDTDLAWTRLTPWRTLMAAALDQFPARLTGVTIEAERNNASADLLSAWLESRLRLPVRQVNSAGPGITAVRMTTAAGDIAITRPDGLLASYAVPGQPDRLVALKRRTTAELVAEELRRMDHDVVYEDTMRAFLQRSRDGRSAGRKATSKPATAKKTTSKTATPKATTTRAATRAATTKATAAKATAKRATAKKATAQRTTAQKSATRKAAR
jgi:glucose-6-phosphate dehydrogenase assembly protein OpcA